MKLDSKSRRRIIHDKIILTRRKIYHKLFTTCFSQHWIKTFSLETKKKVFRPTGFSIICSLFLNSHAVINEKKSFKKLCRPFLTFSLKKMCQQSSRSRKQTAQKRVKNLKTTRRLRWVQENYYLRNDYVGEALEKAYMREYWWAQPGKGQAQSNGSQGRRINMTYIVRRSSAPAKTF